MDNSEIASFVNGFNIVLIAVMSIFAFLGAVMIFRRKILPRFYASGGKAAKRQKKNVQSAGGDALLYAFCVAALAAFALEVTLFNVPSYLKPFGGPELNIVGSSPDDPNVILTSGGAPAEMISEKDENSNVQSAGVGFKKLDMNVTSVFVQVDFGSVEMVDMVLSWTDELTNTNSLKKKLIQRLPYDNYTALQPYGKVSELKVMFTGAPGESKSIEIRDVALNKRIPFYFSGLRLATLSFIVFAAICLFRRESRAKAAYYLFEYKFNPADWKQNIAYALLVIMLIIFSYICINTSYSKSYLEYPAHQIYNKFLTDALADGRTWLNYGNPENLLKAERPYDNSYRIANGYKFNTDVMWEWSWYKGKFYCYFGVVPAVMLYLPYKLITDEYLSVNAGLFLFIAVITVLMALIWRFCVKKYMPNARFVFYILSFLTLFFTSGMFAQLRWNRVHNIVQSAGLMFALAGCLLLFKSVDKEKINRLKLFLACLCLALVAGCRPNLIFVSLLVPVVLWKYRSWKLLPIVAIPYVIIAIPLCVYNYVRFDSIFEFGQHYVLGVYNDNGTKLIVPFGNIIRTFKACVLYILAPGKYTVSFPFVECYTPLDTYVDGLLQTNTVGLGMINFPIVFCLLYLFKNNKINTVNLYIYASLIIAAIIVICDSLLVGFQARYLFDFAVFVILPSLFCAYSWCADNTFQNKYHSCVVYALLVLSVFVGSFICVMGAHVVDHQHKVFDPVIYRYLELSLSVLGIK